MSMTKEEKEAIKILEAQASTKVRENQYLIFHKEATVTVLNLIQKQDKEIEHWKKGFERELENNRKNTCELLKQDLIIREKDKQINLMAKKLNQAYFDEDKFFKWFEKMMGVQEKMDYGYVVDLIKQYFERKVKDGRD